MKRTAIIFFLFCVGTSAFAQIQVLVTPQWLNEHKADANVVILQVGTLKYEYDQEHITGASFLWAESLAPNSPYGNYNAPEPAKATEVLRALGVSKDSHVVLYYVRSEVPITARMFLTLENLGLRGRVSVLNGGLDAWKKENYALTTDAPIVKKGNITVTVGNLLVDKDYVVKTLASKTAVVADARMSHFYAGEPSGNPRDGHIAGAVNIPYTELVDGANKIKSDEQLTKLFTPADGKKEIVTYCFIGQTASVVYLAGRVLGYDMKLYDGSMQEWSRLKELPMETSAPKKK
jgi:thiosulfate/3-mercaptopyruvate sulfurtransferase